MDIQFDKMTDLNEKKRIIQDLERVNNEHTSVRKNFYYIHRYSELDHDIIVRPGKVVFSGMEITLMRQPGQYNDDRHICLAFCEPEDVEQVCSDLEKLDKNDYYTIILIKDAWQIQVRKLIQRCSKLGNYNLMADEFQVYNKISQTCKQSQGFIKFRGERIQKVVATVSELDDTEQEQGRIAKLEKKLREDEREEAQLRRI